VAYTYGSRVIGVVLTGYLDDGTSGLYCIQRLGGLAVVQDPRDAQSPAMPANALEYVEADHIVPLAELGALLVRLTMEPVPTVKTPPTEEELELMEVEITIAKQDNAFELGIIGRGQPTQFTCPDCHGVMTSLIEGKLIRFRCHTGHAYTISALLSEVTGSVQSMLFQSMRGLEETKLLLLKMGEHFVGNEQPKIGELFFQKAEQAGKQAHLIHDSILKHELLSGDLQFQGKKVKPKEGV
jgi:two-component system chemotaxis response regulator CheB